MCPPVYNLNTTFGGHRIPNSLTSQVDSTPAVKDIKVNQGIKGDKGDKGDPGEDGLAGIVESETPPDNTNVLWVDPNDEVGYETITVTATGNAVSYTAPTIYNTFDSPTSGDLTDTLSNAQLGVVQKIYHFDSVEPTVPAHWVRIGFVPYQPNFLNLIFAEYVGNGRVEYWVMQ
jgi:hypothetical protein